MMQARVFLITVILGQTLLAHAAPGNAAENYIENFITKIQAQSGRSRETVFSVFRDNLLAMGFGGNPETAKIANGDFNVPLETQMRVLSYYYEDETFLRDVINQGVPKTIRREKKMTNGRQAFTRSWIEVPGDYSRPIRAVDQFVPDHLLAEADFAAKTSLGNSPSEFLDRKDFKELEAVRVFHIASLPQNSNRYIVHYDLTGRLSKRYTLVVKTDPATGKPNLGMEIDPVTGKELSLGFLPQLCADYLVKRELDASKEQAAVGSTESK